MPPGPLPTVPGPLPTVLPTVPGPLPTVPGPLPTVLPTVPGPLPTVLPTAPSTAPTPGPTSTAAPKTGATGTPALHLSGRTPSPTWTRPPSQQSAQKSSQPTYDVTPQQIDACVPALQTWSRTLTDAQTALQSYTTDLASVQQRLAKAASAPSASSGSGGPRASAASDTGTPAKESSGGTPAKESAGGTPSATGSGGSGGSGGSAAGATGGSGTPDKSSSAGTSTGSSSGGASSGSRSSGPTAPAGSSPLSAAAQTAKELSDQATITADEQALSAAQDSLGEATLTAPIAGVVGQIAVAAGQGESGSQGVTIVGGGAATVTVQVPLANLPAVKQGEAATVNPPGLGPIKGSVSQVSLLPASSTTSPPTYAVTVLLPDTPQTLATGSKVSTSIVTAAASNVLTVPASALPGFTSGSAQVQLLRNGRLTTAAVRVGAVGGGLVEIQSGLTQGDQVVIADANAALPTNQTANVRGLTGGGGVPRTGGGRGSGGAPAGR